MVCAIAFSILIACGGAPALSAEKVLHSFQGGSDGLAPQAGVIADDARNLYGTTVEGGDTGCGNNNNGCGTVFELSPDGTGTVLHAFAGGCDGANPYDALTADKMGNLFGTTVAGGACNNDGGFGTVFMLSPDGTESVLYAFKGGSNGGEPWGNLILDGKGNMYGTTAGGGNMADCDGNGCGTVFELTPKGKQKVIYAFQGGSDGEGPFAGVIMDKAGNLFGTTENGGGSPNCGGGCGTVFKITPSGAETLLYSFQGGSDGWIPRGDLIMDSGGNLYGTTQGGGSSNDGTVFKIAPDGAETLLYAFQPGADGEFPSGGVIMDKSGALYGTTYYGGGSGCKGDGCGVVFKLAPDGTETVLYAFKTGHDGEFPDSALLAGKNGALYGTASAGGKHHDGVVFRVKD